jgi:hypothetical protein
MTIWKRPMACAWERALQAYVRGVDVDGPGGEEESDAPFVPFP